MSGGITYAEARQRFDAGDYAFKAPPVSTVYWSRDDWIVFVFGVRQCKNCKGDLDIAFKPIHREQHAIVCADCGGGL